MAEPLPWTSLSAIADAMEQTMKAYEATGTSPWDHRTALRDLAYQAGGLLKLDMQINGERHSQGQSPEQLCASVETELAEIVALALFIAKKMNLDIARGFHAMLDQDAAKIASRPKD